MEPLQPERWNTRERILVGAFWIWFIFVYPIVVIAACVLLVLLMF